METLALQPIAPEKHGHICIEDRIWFLNVSAKSREVQKFIFPGWNSPQIFGNDHPVFIEYCSGNGAWIAEKAAAHPELNWVAVEYKFSRVKKIWGHIQRRQLSNLFIINGEALEVTKNFFAASSIAGVYINFPDPWPKRTHAKHRIINPHFAKEVARILIPEACLTFVTDNHAFSDWSLGILLAMQAFTPLYPTPHYITEWPTYGNSFFDTLWRSKGKVIRYHQFTRTLAA